jgi:hypothetical protein
MLECLRAPASSPPRNALSRSPRIASLISLYFMCRNMGALPGAGGLLDQRADHYAYFTIFSSAESEHRATL